MPRKNAVKDRAAFGGVCRGNAGFDRVPSRSSPLGHRWRGRGDCRSRTHRPSERGWQDGSKGLARRTRSLINKPTDRSRRSPPCTAAKAIVARLADRRGPAAMEARPPFEPFASRPIFTQSQELLEGLRHRGRSRRILLLGHGCIPGGGKEPRGANSERCRRPFRRGPRRQGG